MKWLVTLTAVAAVLAAPAVAHADVVTDWNRAMIAGLEASRLPPTTYPRPIVGALSSRSISRRSLARWYGAFGELASSAPLPGGAFRG